ncbi:MAG: beta-ketoacyl-ACP synthase II, partial [Pseudomonadota bacterium]
LDNPSFDTDIDLIPHKAKRAPVRAALSNSFGFGGTNAALILKAVD